MSQVFVFAETPFGRDVAGLLYPETDLEALGWETDLDQAIGRIQKIHPPAVIVAGDHTDGGPAVARIQAECPGIQIADVNLDTQTVRLYGGEGRILQELKDLLATVERLASPRDKGQAS